MRHTNSWIAKAVVLVLMAFVGVAVMTATGSLGEPVAQTAPASRVLCAANDAGQSDFLSAAGQGQQASPQPAAICKLMPECWSNSDCDWKCGAGLGKCIHSKCPVRICVCR